MHVESNKKYTDVSVLHTCTCIHRHTGQLQRMAQVQQSPVSTTMFLAMFQCGSASVFSTPPFLFSTPATFTYSLLPSLYTPPPPTVSLSWAPGIFRYWSPHYGSIQPQQTHKQISRLRRSQSPSPSLLHCAIRPQHTPVRWARGKAYCRLQPPLAPPPNPSASQPRVTAAPNTIKSHLQNAQA